jgi:hypothetical protein
MYSSACVTAWKYEFLIFSLFFWHCMHSENLISLVLITPEHLLDTFFDNTEKSHCVPNYSVSCILYLIVMAPDSLV